MNRLQYLLTAKTQYDIQSPFLFDLYGEVLNTYLGRDDMVRHGLQQGDIYGELRFKLMDHYGACVVDKGDWEVDELFMSAKHGKFGIMRKPHGDNAREKRWKSLIQREEVTLSVDLFDVGIIFTDSKLSKQNVLFRCS